MPGAAALDSLRTGTPDNSSGLKIASILSKDDSTIEIPAGFALVETLPNAPSAHRSSGGADASTDMSSSGFGTSTELIENRGALIIWVEFATAGATCTLIPVWYDDSATPAPMALGPSLTFTATAKRVTSSGNYMSEAVIIDTHSFARYKIFKETVSAGNIVVHATPV